MSTASNGGPSSVVLVGFGYRFPEAWDMIMADVPIQVPPLTGGLCLNTMVARPSNRATMAGPNLMSEILQYAPYRCRPA